MKFFHFIAVFIVFTVTFNTWDICYKSCHRDDVSVKPHCSHVKNQEQAAAKLQPKPCCEHQFIFNQELKNSIPNEVAKVTAPILGILPFNYPPLVGLQKSLLKQFPSHTNPFFYAKQHTVMRV